MGIESSSLRPFIPSDAGYELSSYYRQGQTNEEIKFGARSRISCDRTRRSVSMSCSAWLFYLAKELNEVEPRAVWPPN